MIRLENGWLVALAALLTVLLGVIGCGSDDTTTSIGEACDSSADCDDDQICWRAQPGGYSECANPTDDLEIGEECAVSTDCRSGLCFEGMCNDECEGLGECPDEMACRSIEVDDEDDDEVAICDAMDECLHADECGGDECIVDRNGEIDLYCNVPVGPEPQGDECGSDLDCETGLCIEGVCSAPCVRPEDCQEVGFLCTGEDLGDGETTNICTEGEPGQCLSDGECLEDQRCVATTSDDEVIFQCGPPNEGGKEGGEACDEDADCAQSLCHDGVCQAPCYADEVCTQIPASSCTATDVEQNGVEGTVNTCDVPPFCESPFDCQEDETCWVERGDEAVHTTCEVPDGGELQDGQPCQEDADCASNYCHEDVAEDYCATPCEFDEDCPEAVGGIDMSCRTAELEYDGGSDAVDVCLRDEPPACDTDSDCTDEQACAVVVDSEDGGISTVCLPDNDGMDTSMPCDEDADCTSRHCTDGSCAAPCDSYQDCDPYQVCDTESVHKDGESTELELCTSLDFTPCQSPGECDAENTTCNTPLLDDDNFVEGASCGITYPGQADLGEECTEMGDCESAYCWSSDDGTTGECSVFCQDSAQDCGSEQVCVQRAADLGACLGECLNNDQCDGGNVCKFAPDPNQEKLQTYCGNTLSGADTDTGGVCDVAEDCDNGLCLTVTTYETTGEDCTDDGDCDTGYQCACPPEEPNCDSDDTTCVEESGTQEQRCSELCDPANGDADCQGGDHDLSVCGDDIYIEWGSIETTLSVCTLPEDE